MTPEQMLEASVARQRQKFEERDRLQRACRAATDRVVRVWIDALEAVDADGAPDWGSRIKASALLAGYGYGRPAQAITGMDGGPVQITLDDQRARLASLRERYPELLRMQGHDTDRHDDA